VFWVTLYNVLRKPQRSGHSRKSIPSRAVCVTRQRSGAAPPIICARSGRRVSNALRVRAWRGAVA
jgi:hypothetical protein